VVPLRARPAALVDASALTDDTTTYHAVALH
jgi:hypothetical protein